ncbi:MAG TPA: glucans biosynthesis glucosyltransferase MdoH [Vineibacter sp.]|nr:glucans biosynthesis glucosyltransferase MdoH [Vineibacter sp.]
MLRLDSKARWAFWRRGLMGALVLAATTGATWLMAVVLNTNNLTVAEGIVLAVFALSFAWITVSFWAAVAGFVLSLLRRHPVTLRRESAADGPLAALDIRSAIVMPIYNEDTSRVFAGLIATYRSLESTGQLAQFDFFVLSDTTDPDIWVAEEALWHDTCRRLGAGGRLFYRHRAANTGRKAGNIADWVQNHGAAYECFIVLDADSVMAGDTIVRLAGLMEANPRTGIIQTLAIAANRTTLFARWLQFASRLYGPLLAVGHSFWWAGEGNYYGHNAILRVRPFAAHCGLPRLPGKPPLGGEIMSHDFVEAACMRRGGWHVFFLPELRGSFEEIPSNIVDYAVRDRRWAQGNLQHARILPAPRLHWVSRLHLAMGVLAFVASPLWLLLLFLSSYVVIQQAITGHAYFLPGYNLFPIWPEFRPLESHALLAATASVLLLPKLLSLALALASRRRRRAFGGGTRLLASAAVEMVFSVLLAPVMMLFHSTFVLTILAGRSVGWNAQRRDDRGVAWSEAARRHAVHSLIGLLWGGVVFWYAIDFLWWVAPIVAGMALAIPLNALSSRTTTGLAAQRRGLFWTPEETAPPNVLQSLEEELERLADWSPPSFAEVLGEPRLAALHLALLPGRPPAAADLIDQAERAAIQADALAQVERRALLGSAVALEHAISRAEQRRLRRAA